MSNIGLDREMTDWEKILKIVNDGGCAVVSSGDIPERVFRDNAGAATRFADDKGYQYVDFFNRRGLREASASKENGKWEYYIIVDPR